MIKPLPRTFYAQSALTVARQLLGAPPLRVLKKGVRVSGRHERCI